MLNEEKFNEFQDDILTDTEAYPVHAVIGTVEIAGYESPVSYDSDTESLRVEKADLNIPLKNGPCALLNLNYEQFTYILATALAEEGILSKEEIQRYEPDIPAVRIRLDKDDFANLGQYPTSNAEEVYDEICFAINVVGAYFTEQKRLNVMSPEQRVTTALQELSLELASKGLSLPEIGKAIQNGAKTAIQKISAQNIEQKLSR